MADVLTPGSRWPVRIAGGVGAAAGSGGALLWRPDLGGFGPGLIAFSILTGVGIVLGQLVGGLLFPPSSGGGPEDRTRTS
jgi:hypothetical protein